MPLQPGDSYFWLRPVIYERDVELASLAWSDAFEEAFAFLSNVRKEADGQLHRNVDQGWHIEFIGQGDDLYVRTGDPDLRRPLGASEPHANRFTGSPRPWNPACRASSRSPSIPSAPTIGTIRRVGFQVGHEM